MNGFHNVLDHLTAAYTPKIVLNRFDRPQSVATSRGVTWPWPNRKVPLRLSPGVWKHVFPLRNGAASSSCRTATAATHLGREDCPSHLSVCFERCIWTVCNPLQSTKRLSNRLMKQSPDRSPKALEENPCEAKFHQASRLPQRCASGETGSLAGRYSRSWCGALDAEANAGRGSTCSPDQTCQR